ncbi:MAG: hypothetical protein Q8K55_07425 [Gemmatimonadaceae bacterium]|nr:hypothetical protein [Gemmatimonadaceae bacterium]
MEIELLVLRIIHVVGAILWGGTAMFVAFFLMPAMGMAGPAGAPVMGALVKRRLFVIVPTVAVITMLAGLRLLWRISDGYSAAYFATSAGMTYFIGTIVSITGFAIFLTVSRPALGKMGTLQQQMAQAAESERGALMTQMNAVRGRAGAAAKAIALLLIIATVTMAIARYMN